MIKIGSISSSEGERDGALRQREGVIEAVAYLREGEDLGTMDKGI